MENQIGSSSPKRRAGKDKRGGYQTPRLVRYGGLKELTRGGGAEIPCAVSKDLMTECENPGEAS